MKASHLKAKWRRKQNAGIWNISNMMSAAMSGHVSSGSSELKTKHAGVTQDYRREPEQTIACTDTAGQRCV